MKKAPILILFLLILSMFSLSATAAPSIKTAHAFGAAKQTATSIDIAPLPKDSNLKLEYVWFVLRANQLPGLVGSDIRSLHVASCIDGKLVEGEVYVLPRELDKTFVAELNTTTLIPLYDNTTIEANDLLLLLVPVPAQAMPSSTLQCGWGRNYAMLRLHNRIEVFLDDITKYKRLIVGSGLPSPYIGGLHFYIYFNKLAQTNEPLYPSHIPNMGLLVELAKRLNIRVDTNTSTWYKKLVSVLTSRTSSVYIRASLETVKGWIMNKDYSQIKTIVKGTDTIGPTVTPATINYIDGSGGGSLKFYWFALTLDKQLPGIPIQLSPGQSLQRNTIYIGSYVEDVGLHLKIENPSTSMACVRIELYVYKYDSGTETYTSLVTSVVRTYYIDPETNVSIEVAPQSIPWSSEKLGVKPIIKNCGSTEIVLRHASLDFLKSYPSMPVPEQRQGLQILSYGIKILSQSLSRIDNIEVNTLPGLYFVPTPQQEDSFSFTFSHPNGIFLNYNYGEDDNAVLYLDLAVRAVYSTVSGYIKAYVNGYQVLDKSITIQAGDYKIIRLDIPLRLYTDYFKWAGGGIITIKAYFNDYTVIYIDSMIKYNYLPEVWNTGTENWVKHVSPALKVLLSANTGVNDKSNTAYELSYGVESPYVLPSKHEALLFALDASGTAAVNSGIHSGTLIVKVPSEILGSMPVVGSYKHEKGYSILDEIEKYIGIANTLHHVISTAITVLDFVVNVGKKVNAAVFIAGTVIDIIKAAKGQATLEVAGTETINGIVYKIYRYSWSAGWGEDPKWLQMRVYVGVSTSNEGAYYVYIGGGINGWKLKDTPARIVITYGNPSPSEPVGFYGRNDIGYG
jgi:hypothetical protein